MQSEQLVEAVCQCRCFIAGTRWDDGLTEGAARIERMIAEKQIAAISAVTDASGLVEALEQVMHCYSLEKAHEVASASLATYQGVKQDD